MLYNPPAAPVLSYIFLDGGSSTAALRKVADVYFEGELPSLDWSRVRGPHRKAFYYDAVPVRQMDEDENTYADRIAPKLAELGVIERQPGFHVRTGDVRRRSRKRGNEQKMVDVQLAVDALSMASRGLFRSMTLVTGDLDFLPLVVALVEMGVDVSLLYPPGDTAPDLIAAADVATPLSVRTAMHWIPEQFPLRYRVPTASYSFGLPDHEERLPARSEWRSADHGQCRIVQASEHQWVLLSSSNPTDTHQLRIEGRTEELLRAYAKEMFGLEPPPRA